PQSDLYACGALLHELIQGTNEFRGSDLSETVGRVLKHQPSPLEGHVPGVRSGFDAIVARALAKDPAQRYETAAAFAEDLRTLRGIDESTMDTSLRERISYDFRGPMTAELNVVPLDELEQSWREPPEALLRSDLRPASLRPGADEHTDVDVTPPNAMGKRGLWFGLAGVVVALGIGLGFFLPSPTPTDPPEFTVQRAPPPTPAHSKEPPASKNTPVQEISESSRGADGLTLEDSVRRKGRSFVNCYERHRAKAPEGLQGTLVFRIAAEGTTESVVLESERSDTGELGECVLGAARSIRFAPRSESVTFRIPLSLSPGS
ncbi:MAG: hypothetical protein KC416_06840, partial [Myxococcales bacterium]|nr:hypothetical protein [Myxococcales bacterium]